MFASTEEAEKKVSLKLVEFSDPKFFMQFGKDEYFSQKHFLSSTLHLVPHSPLHHADTHTHTHRHS